jgi:hypothetical protein
VNRKQLNDVPLTHSTVQYTKNDSQDTLNNLLHSNITYNNYLHEEHIHDVDHQKIPNKLFSILSFPKITISDLNTSSSINLSNSSNTQTTPNYFDESPTLTTTKCNKSKIIQFITTDSPTPSISKALKSINKDKWIDAIKLEVSSLLDHQILLPIDYHTLPYEFEYIDITTKLKLKFKANGDIDKYKARSCGRGDQLEQLLSHVETFSPTISDETFLLLMQLSIIYEWVSFNIDTVSAFLHQIRPPSATKIYTRIDKKICEICGLNPQQFYIIDKYIYGLPDSGKAYYEAIRTLLIENQFAQSIVDNCLFYMINTIYHIYIIIYVDDTYIFSNKHEGITYAKSVFQSKFPIQDSDPSNYLGLHIHKTTTDATTSFKITQPKLLQEIVHEFLPNYNEKPSLPTFQRNIVPINKLINYDNSAQPIIDNLSNKTINKIKTYQQYMHLLGKLQYLVKSRPDIKLALSYLATKSNNHTQADYNALIHIVKYLSTTTELGLVLHKHCGNPLTIHCYVDASYLSHEDSKSHTGYTISFGPTGSFISKSKKQNLISTSSMHAEARAVYTLIQTLINIYVILIELQLPIQLPIIVFEDNEALIYSTTNTTAKNKKCRHFMMLVNFIKEQIQHGLIKFYKVPSANNTADLLAKPTFGPDFLNKRKSLGVL